MSEEEIKVDIYDAEADSIEEPFIPVELEVDNAINAIESGEFVKQWALDLGEEKKAKDAIEKLKGILSPEDHTQWNGLNFIAAKQYITELIKTHNSPEYTYLRKVRADDALTDAVTSISELDSVLVPLEKLNVDEVHKVQRDLVALEGWGKNIEKQIQEVSKGKVDNKLNEPPSEPMELNEQITHGIARLDVIGRSMVEYKNDLVTKYSEAVEARKAAIIAKRDATPAAMEDVDNTFRPQVYQDADIDNLIGAKPDIKTEIKEEPESFDETPTQQQTDNNNKEIETDNNTEMGNTQSKPVKVEDELPATQEIIDVDDITEREAAQAALPGGSSETAIPIEDDTPPPQPKVKKTRAPRAPKAPKVVKETAKEETAVTPPPPPAVEEVAAVAKPSAPPKKPRAKSAPKVDKPEVAKKSNKRKDRDAEEVAKEEEKMVEEEKPVEKKEKKSSQARKRVKKADENEKRDNDADFADAVKNTPKVEKLVVKMPKPNKVTALTAVEETSKAVKLPKQGKPTTGRSGVKKDKKIKTK